MKVNSFFRNKRLKKENDSTNHVWKLRWRYKLKFNAFNSFVVYFHKFIVNCRNLLYFFIKATCELNLTLLSFPFHILSFFKNFYYALCNVLYLNFSNAPIKPSFFFFYVDPTKLPFYKYVLDHSNFNLAFYLLDVLKRVISEGIIVIYLVSYNQYLSLKSFVDNYVLLQKFIYIFSTVLNFCGKVISVIWYPFGWIMKWWTTPYAEGWLPLNFHFYKWWRFLSTVCYWGRILFFRWLWQQPYNIGQFLLKHDKTGVTQLVLYIYYFTQILEVEVRFLLGLPLNGKPSYLKKAKDAVSEFLGKIFGRKKYFSPRFYENLNQIYFNYNQNVDESLNLSFNNFSFFSYKKVNCNLRKMMHEHQWPIRSRTYQCYNALGFFIPDVVDRIEKIKLQYSSARYHNFKRSIYRNTIETRTLIFWYGMFMILPFLSAVAISRMKRPWNQEFLQEGFFRKARRLKKYKFISFQRFRKFFTPLELKAFTVKPHFYSFKFYLFIFSSIYILFIIFLI